MIYTINNIKSEIHQKLSIFSYINSTDSELIILETNTVLKLNNYINNGNIENNIFGVDLFGIKILKLPNSEEIGVYYFSKLKNNIIFENEILLAEDEIYFVYDNDKLNTVNGKYTIEMAGIVQEKEYSRAIEFTIHYEYHGNDSPELYYKRKINIGRTSFYNFTIPNTLSGSYTDACGDKCKVCYNNKCIKCKDSYKLMIDTNITNICQNESNDNFYFDEKNNLYKKCHEFCKSCSKMPIYYSDIFEIKDSNCNECIENYIYIHKKI